MAEGHSQHGCHGALHPEHPSFHHPCPKGEAWANPGAPGVRSLFKIGQAEKFQLTSMQVSYYTPLQDFVPGSARDPEKAPLLFQPLTVKGMRVPNRIMVRYGWKTLCLAWN
jgi:hypothetical protein